MKTPSFIEKLIGSLSGSDGDVLSRHRSHPGELLSPNSPEHGTCHSEEYEIEEESIRVKANPTTWIESKNDARERELTENQQAYEWITQGCRVGSIHTRLERKWPSE